MKREKHFWQLLAASLLIGGGVMNTLNAQEAGFDLNTQRSEKQSFQMVPGHKVDHHGLLVNPIPHEMKVDDAAAFDLTRGFRIKDVHGKFGHLLPESTKGGTQLTIDYGEKLAKKHGVREVSGAYSVNIGKKGVQIVGYDERGAFYGVQTLLQLLSGERGQKGVLPYITINDYPDLEFRGVIEGFYGTPWSHEVRLSLIDFYGKFKMNSYQYGPKDDPYHSFPNWRLPYPEKEAKQIKELVEACNRNYVDFVWAIHPGKDIKWNEEDYQNLLKKFNMMYDLGVRSFAIYFDDISGEGTNPNRQVELLNRLTNEFVKVKPGVSTLTVCPTDYSKLWANPTPQGSLSIYGRTLDPSVKVFWTGDVVCSDLTRETVEWVNSRIKRPVYYWWNFPVTDYCRHIVMQGPAYGLDTTMTSKDISGFGSNPMEHGEASKLALYGVADYAWNVAAYNPIDSWERGLEELTPEAKDAYRTFAIHSCDTETGYRRAESWETKTFGIHNYTQAEYDALLSEFNKVAAVPETMEKNCKNHLLMNELRPWLVEFGKLGQRGAKTLSLLKTYEKGDLAAFWKGYIENLMTLEDLKAYQAHKSGTMKLQPFYEVAMDDMRDGFFKKVAGEIPSTLKGIGSFATLATTQSKLMFDNDTTSYYHSGASQGEQGDWVGVDMGIVKPVWEVNILQGRNSVDDVDYFDHATLEYSADGKTWQSLIADMEKVYVVNWKGEPVNARYVRLRKLSSPKRSWLSVRSFEINPVRAEKLGFAVKSDAGDAALYAFDRHPGTSFMNKGTLSFDIPSDVKGYTMLLKLQNGAKVEIAQLDRKGKELSVSTVDAPLYRIECAKGATQIQVKGQVEIYEIIGNR